METLPTAKELRSRARRMRRWALGAPAPLASAYRRRACELEFLAVVREPLPARINAA
jgi:hypothetical protein